MQGKTSSKLYNWKYPDIDFKDEIWISQTDRTEKSIGPFQAETNSKSTIDVKIKYERYPFQKYWRFGKDDLPKNNS